MGFCGSGSNKTVEPKQFDPIFPGSGGAELRSNIFGLIPSAITQSQTDANLAARAAQTGAGMFGGVQNYANDLMGGRYLNSSPQLQRAMQQSTQATQNALDAARAASDIGARNQYAAARGNLADQQRRLQSQFARTGQTFGTGMSQAQDAAGVALNAQIAQNEAARQAQLGASQAQAMSDVAGRNLGLEAARLQQERQLQNAAPSIAGMAATKPFELLSTVPGLRYAGLEPAAALTGALAGGGQVVNPNTYYKPGALDYGLQAASIGAMFSDITLKSSIKDIDDMLNRVMMVRPKSYIMVDRSTREYGVIAQELETVFPELVTTKTHPEFGAKKTVNYQQLAVLTLKALQELTERVESLEEVI